jgi:hypothetical protein
MYSSNSLKCVVAATALTEAAVGTIVFVPVDVDAPLTTSVAVVPGPVELFRLTLFSRKPSEDC